MIKTDIVNFKNYVCEYFDETIKYNNVVNVKTKNGNAIVMSEESYNNLMDILFSGQPTSTLKYTLDGKRKDYEVFDYISTEKNLQ